MPTPLYDKNLINQLNSDGIKVQSQIYNKFNDVIREFINSGIDDFELRYLLHTSIDNIINDELNVLRELYDSNKIDYNIKFENLVHLESKTKKRGTVIGSNSNGCIILDYEPEYIPEYPFKVEYDHKGDPKFWVILNKFRL